MEDMNLLCLEFYKTDNINSIAKLVEFYDNYLVYSDNTQKENILSRLTVGTLSKLYKITGMTEIIDIPKDISKETLFSYLKAFIEGYKGAC